MNDRGGRAVRVWEAVRDAVHALDPATPCLPAPRDVALDAINALVLDHDARAARLAYRRDDATNAVLEVVFAPLAEQATGARVFVQRTGSARWPEWLLVEVLGD